jgi:hypothetical protein
MSNVCFSIRSLPNPLEQCSGHFPALQPSNAIDGF